MPALKDIKQKLLSGSFSELARGSFRSFLLRIIGTVVSYVFTVTVTRMMGADVYGAFMLAQTVMMISVMVARMGLDTVLLRWVSSFRATGDEERIPQAFRQALGLALPVGFGLTLLFWILAPWLGDLLFDAEAGPSYLRW
ncbi:MAG: lipopolysaccharide biosynthesis protein, partial [Flavobacteriales bacterium]